MSAWGLRSRRVLTPEGVRAALIEVRDGRIVALHAHDAPPAALAIIDVGDDVVMPGLVDTHVHVNEPGRTAWEGFASATRAAAAGGVTTLLDMPLNSIPATVSRAGFASKQSAAQGQCHVDVGFLGGVVPGREREIAGLADAGVLGFKCFLSPSGVDEFPCVGESELAAALPGIARLGAVLMAHAESPAVLAAAPAPLATRHYAEYAASRPAAAETAAIALFLRLAQAHGARVHVVHVSSAESLPLIAAARANGVRVTAETCPHYLHFAAGDVPEGATEYKCAPPIRSAADRNALWAALADGTLDLVVSDHSPCPPAMKQRESGDFMAAWGGIASLQLGLPVVWSGMRTRGLPIERLAHWMCEAPARLAGLSRKGRLAPGADADLVVWSPERTFTVRGSALHHRHPLTPYEGATLHGVVQASYLRGERVYDAQSGVREGLGRLLYREIVLS